MNTRTGLIALPAALGLLLAPLPAAAERSADPAVGIAATLAEWQAAVAAGDAAGVAAAYTEDAQIFPPGSPPVEGAAAIAAFFEAILGLGVEEIRIETVEVGGMGELAYEVGRYTVVGAEGAELERGKSLVIWKRVGDRWRLHRDIWNADAPAAAGAAEEAHAH